MASILTNASAMTALTTLRSINSELNTTQNRISTGMSVSSAADNAAYWSIATTMRSDNSTLSATTQSLGIGASQADAASTGINSLLSVLKSVRDRVASAGQSGIDQSKVQTELDQLFEQMESIIESSSVNGVNWLAPTGRTAKVDAAASIVSGVGKETTTSGTPPVTVTTTKLQTIDVSITVDGTGTEKLTAGELVDSITAVGSKISLSNSGKSDIEGFLTRIDKVTAGLTDLGSIFGAASNRIKIQQEFTKNLTDALSRAVGSLVDADLDSESTKLKALQTQQQLAVQALSIANSNTQTILSLFRN